MKSYEKELKGICVMPRKPKHPCSYPGCPNLTDERYCTEHKKKTDASYNRYQRDEDSQSFYNSYTWKEVRRRQLDAVPYCEECLRSGRLTKATMVDHRVPIKDGGERYAHSNLQSLCWSCHSRKSIHEGSRFGRRVYAYAQKNVEDGSKEKL